MVKFKKEREFKVLIHVKKGRHIICFDRSTLPKGIYFLRITHNGKSETKKVIVVE